MNYWLDLFTGTSWREFQDAGATTSGFRAQKKVRVSRVKPGDIFLCYLTHVMRWVGALEIIGPSSNKKRIWQDDEYPVRLEVRPLVMLAAENGIPMEELEGNAPLAKPCYKPVHPPACYLVAVTLACTSDGAKRGNESRNGN